MANVNAKFATGRLESLKQSTILDGCADINLDSAYDIYNTMIKLFINGNFDPIFNSPSFNDLMTNERRELLKNGRKYFNLCLGNGGIDNWTSYASKFCGDDYDLCFINVFKNFDTLLTILRYGKEDSMELLSNLDNYKGNFDGSIIDQLRLFFPNEKILVQAMTEMGQKTNAFSQYSDNYKSILCKYANGILYNKENGEYNFRSPLSIALDVREKITGENDPYTFSYEKYSEIISNANDFTDAIMDLSSDYVLKNKVIEHANYNI